MESRHGKGKDSRGEMVDTALEMFARLKGEVDIPGPMLLLGPNPMDIFLSPGNSENRRLRGELPEEYVSLSASHSFQVYVLTKLNLRFQPDS